jgi:hypothetical protein
MHFLLLRSFNMQRVDAPQSSSLLVARSGAYLIVLLAVVLAAGIYRLRERSIFNCQATGYGADRYLAYCGAAAYGDYDYGAFWFDLEPSALAAAANAKVLFLGNSRMQFALSAKPTDDWFRAVSVPYYLLGFAYNGNARFAEPLVRRLGATPNVYVINLDLFFENSDTPPAAIVMRDNTATSRYEEKREWQGAHKTFCASLPVFCGDEVAFFRSRPTGAWVVTGGQFRNEPVSYNENVDHTVANAYAIFGKDFLSHLNAVDECEILTMVPTVDTSIGTAKSVAQTLGRQLVAPQLSGLDTFDQSHLDQPSAERWSAAFMAEAGPQIQKCLMGR